MPVAQKLCMCEHGVFRVLFLRRFLKERVYCYNQRSLEKLKRSVEQTVANTEPEILRKDTRNTLIARMLVFEVMNIFDICCKAVLFFLRNEN